MEEDSLGVMMIGVMMIGEEIVVIIGAIEASPPAARARLIATTADAVAGLAQGLVRGLATATAVVEGLDTGEGRIVPILDLLRLDTGGIITLLTIPRMIVMSILPPSSNRSCFRIACQRLHFPLRHRRLQEILLWALWTRNGISSKFLTHLYL